MAVNAFFVEDAGLPREGVLVNNIAFTSLGRLWVRQAECTLSGDNALICASMVSMLVKGVQHHHGTTETLVTNETQPVMYYPQVVDDGPLILSILSTPRAVSITGKTLDGIGVVDSLLGP